MLTKRPSDRISILEAINHPWFHPEIRGNSPIISPSVLKSLQKHKSPKKLQREVMKVMLKFLSIEEIEELRQAFLDLDQGKSGFITISDLEKAIEMSGFHLQFEEIRSNCQLELTESLGTANLGQIHYSDFLIATLDKKKLLDNELLYLTFQHFDADFDGFVNIIDLKLALENLGDPSSMDDIAEMISDWDMDNNRLIDFGEFRRMMGEVKEFNCENRSFLSRNGTKKAKSLHPTLTKLTTLGE